MNYINENTVLEFYLEEIKKDNIQFLKNKAYYKEELSLLITQLMTEDNMHNKIGIAKDLWKLLFEASMTYIDSDKGGYDELFKYFDEYVDFEELIFASDSFYRDHTLHCLWVYFLGEYIFRREEFKKIVDRYGESIDEQVDAIKKINELLDNKIDIDRILSMYNVEYTNSIRCVSALTHDLGYPLKKIDKINKCIKKILPFFSIDKYTEFSYGFDSTQNHYNEEFIDFISSGFGMHSINNDKSLTYEEIEREKKINEAFIIGEYSNIRGIREEVFLTFSEEDKQDVINTFNMKEFKDCSVYNKLRYNRDFEKHEHGIMSAFLLMRILSGFSNIRYNIRNNGEIILKYSSKFDTINAKQAILKSISDHTSKNYKLTGLYDTSDFLIFIDEIEEFSRLSRANQNRQYINEFCKTNIYMEDGVFNVDFIFDNEELDNLDPELAFKGRCKKMLSLFDIKELHEDFKIRLRCIGELEFDKNIYEIIIERNFANILINGEEKNIPKYLKSREFFTKEEYSQM